MNPIPLVWHSLGRITILQFSFLLWYALISDWHVVAHLPRGGGGVMVCDSVLYALGSCDLTVM